MSTVTRLITAEELLEMPSDQRRELVKGEVRTMAPSGFEHGKIVVVLGRLLANHVHGQKLGVVLGAETGFTLSRNPDTVRGADVSFIDASRLPPKSTDKFWEGAPDLAVEVVSPTDRLRDVEEKVQEYLSAGARLVWVVNPKRRTVTIHRPGATEIVLGESDELDGEDVVRGFRCRVAEVFE